MSNHSLLLLHKSTQVYSHIGLLVQERSLSRYNLLLIYIHAAYGFGVCIADIQLLLADNLCLR